MKQQQDYSPAGFLAWLDDKISQVNELEAQGREEAAKGDQTAYCGSMRRKALLLAGLEDEATPYLDEMADLDAMDFAARAVASFSFNAGRALDIDSVFYMSALLFPDEHKPGEPNNLELFRDEAKNRLGL